MDVGKDWPSPDSSQNNTIINRMMLKFRPIAPKPTACGPAPDSATSSNKIEPLTKRRTKRKYVRVKKNRTPKIDNKVVREGGGQNDSEFSGTVMTLQLLPENSGPRNSLADEKLPITNIGFPIQERPIWINFNTAENNDNLSARAVDRTDRRVVESWVMVDGMSDTWVDAGGIGSTDMERIKNLEMDACPGLISDGLDRVQWVNLAYRKMVDPHNDGGSPSELLVRLVVKEKISVAPWPYFACTARVIYSWQKEKQYSQIMPCDVWKMDCGGFAWRLDSKAALSLGR